MVIVMGYQKDFTQISMQIDKPDLNASTSGSTIERRTAINSTDYFAFHIVF